MAPAGEKRGRAGGRNIYKKLESRLAVRGDEGSFADDEIAELPEPVRRYFTASIKPGAALAVAARLRMGGEIKLDRWMRFRARQILNPHAGYVWAARVGGIVTGADHYVAGEGGMDWKLAGLKRLVHADGPDVSRAAAGRGAVEAVWIPTALLPRYGVEWTAGDDHTIRAAWSIDEHPIKLQLRIDDDGLVESAVLDRWGDPDETGTWGFHPFGGDLTAHATFHGLTIPSAGRVGWFYGTDRWDEGEFFHFELTDLAPTVGPG